MKMPCKQCGKPAAALGPAIIYGGDGRAHLDPARGDRLMCGACIGQALDDLGSEKADKWLTNTV